MLQMKMFGNKVQQVKTTKLGIMPKIYLINTIE